MSAQGALMLTAKDNVATAVQDIEANTEVEVKLGRDVRKVKALEKIPYGFKIAVADIPKGSQVFKYGEAIGVASSDIKTGQQVHVHNVDGARGRGDMAKGSTQ